MNISIIACISTLVTLLVVTFWLVSQVLLIKKIKENDAIYRVWITINIFCPIVGYIIYLQYSNKKRL